VAPRAPSGPPFPSPADPVGLRLRPRVPVACTPPLSVAPIGRGVPLAEAVPGEEITLAAYGTAYHLRTPVQELTDRLAVGLAFRRAFTPDAPFRAHLATRVALHDVTPADVLFVDLETTGLGHGPLFLIGALVWEGHELVVHQYLARHYGEEAAVCAAFLALAASRKLLLSFNGKCFDIPYLRTRAAATAVPWHLDLPHFDLLHASRRAWRASLPNCRLQTLEHYICGHPPRHGDIPGADIPAAYHAFVHTGDATLLAQILRHNLHDLVTLAELVGKLPA
jgi:uncharacterized protein YprB with RNaseH-like and TPR domain